MRRAMLVGALVGTALGALYGPMPSSGKAEPRWRQSYSSMAELVGAADAIVVGTVASISAGREVDGLPFSDIALGDVEIIKGPAEQDYVIEATGDYFSAGNGRGWAEGVPNFAVGGKYLLFLKRQSIDPYLWYVLNNQAGFSIGRLGNLSAADHHDELALQLDGVRVEAAKARIRVLISAQTDRR